MLMCTVSLILHGVIDVTVHNQYPNIDLVSPIYFCNCGIYNEYPVERTDDGAIMKVDFRFDLEQNGSGGILAYEVQRKGNIGSDHQPSTDTTSTETVEDTSKMMRFLMAWEIERLREPKVHIMLIEYDNEFALNEDKLAQLYGKIDDQLSRRYRASKSTWLVSDNTVMEAKYETVQKGGPKLKITISKGAKEEDTKSTLWIDSERQVSFLMAICSILIYIFSLTLQSTVDIAINNQCSNIELIYPVHFIKDATCHIEFPQKVNFKSVMRVNFKTGMSIDTFGGVLLYHLQRKKNNESDNQSNTDKDASICTQLLMIWGCKPDLLYSSALLIEHESTFNWDKDKLERLYDVYDSQYNIWSTINLGEWLLDDNTILKTVRESSHGDFEMEVVISEEKDTFSPRKPLWIDPDR
jgi:hypothetical protein